MLDIDELKKILTNEELLAVLLCRFHFGLVDKNTITALMHSGRIDYSGFMRLITEHQVRPFIYHIITTQQLELPPEYMIILKDFALANHLRSLEQAMISANICLRMKKKGIQVIPYKGTCFATQFYNNVGLRESTDIDLIADEDVIEAVENDLIEAGYIPKITVPRSYISFYKKHFKEIVYTVPCINQKNGYSVEIHWKLLNGFIGCYPDTSFFLEGAVKEKEPFHTMDPDRSFLAITANHFIKDMSVKLKYLVDVACLLNKDGGDINASLITSITGKYRCRKKMELGLWIAEALFGQKIKDYSYRYSFKNEQLKNCLQVPLSIRSFDIKNRLFLHRSLQLQDKHKDKWRFLWRCAHYFLLPTNNDMNTVLTGKESMAFLIIRRPFRLARKMWEGNKR
jgi:hypothetical protein